MRDENGDRSDDPLLVAILRIVQRSPDGWAGTATDLLRTLDAEVPPHRRGAYWPKDATRIGHRLTHLATVLAGAGVICARAEEGHHNTRIIRLRAGSPSEPNAAGGVMQRSVKGTTPPVMGHGGPAALAALAVIGVGLLLIWLLRRPPPADALRA